MTSRARRLLLTVALCLVWVDARAQAPVTVADLAGAARAAASDVGLRDVDPRAASDLDAALGTLSAAGVFHQEIGTLVGRLSSPGPVALAHRRQQDYTLGLTDAEIRKIRSAFDTVKQLANSVLPGLPGGVPAALREPVRQLQLAEQRLGLASDLETLRRLERKYGPDSAKLNAVEVLAAYGLQRAPLFGVNAVGRPGPLEAVLSYAPSYFSRSAGRWRLVGVAEIGLRQYIFRPGWGDGSGPMRWVRPGYLSYGAAVTGQTDDALTPPWKGSPRFGAFFGWGSLKAAFVGGSDKRLLVTQQFQLVPWVF